MNKDIEVPLAEEASWDSDPKFQTSRKFERLKLENGKTERVLILDKTPVTVFQHYKQGFGYVRCLKSLNQVCYACDSGDNPAQKYGVNVFSYPRGLTDGKSLTLPSLKILAWTFTPRTFQAIKSIRAEWGDPTSYDLKLTAQDRAGTSVAPCREIYLDSAPEMVKAALPEFLNSNKFDLKEKLGRTFTVEQVEGIWTGALTADEIFKKRDKDSTNFPGNDFMAAAAVPTGQAGALETKEGETPTKINWDSLL